MASRIRITTTSISVSAARINGSRHLAGSGNADGAERQSAGAILWRGAIFVVDEDGANIIQLRQRGESGLHDLFALRRNIEQVGAAVGCEDELRIAAVHAFYGFAEQSAAVHGMLRLLATNLDFSVG